MTLEQQQVLFARNVARLIEYIFAQGYSCSFGEAFRTPEQAKIYALRGIGIEDSLHCKRLAIDLNLFSPLGAYLSDSSDYKKFGDYWVTLNPQNRWGGCFKHMDGNHFEMNPV